MNTDTLWLAISILCLGISIVGSVLPVIPGPSLAWLGILIFKFSSYGNNISWLTVIILAVIVLVSMLLDYLIPAWGSKAFGGSKYGVYGALVGIIVGIFFSPLGFIIGPFVGAFLGEIIFNKSEHKDAFKASLGTLLGIFIGIGIDLLICISCLGMVIYYSYFSH